MQYVQTSHVLRVAVQRPIFNSIIWIMYIQFLDQENFALNIFL